MSSDTRTTVRVNRRLDARAERVFDAWLDPASACHWLFATPAGKIVRTEIDAVPGGRFTIVDRRDGEDVEHTGTYEVLDRPRRIVFSFAVPKYSSETSRVTVDITLEGSGCEIILTNERVPEEYASRTEEGWNGILEGLAKSL